MITIVDYGVGNLYSLKSSFSFIGQEVEVSGDVEKISAASKIVLPGVGAFADAAEKLRQKGIDEVLKRKAEEGTPLLGICLGMQLLFDYSLEYGNHRGLSLIKGKVVPMKGFIPNDYKIPQIGWNSLNFHGSKHPIFKYIKEGDFVYFVHSYFAKPDNKENLCATTNYGESVTAAVASRNVAGCQFHPEKSGHVGLDILRGFCEWEGKI